MTIKKAKVLCLTDYYLPGFKGGGPIRTLANMCELLGREAEFSIFTRDRDLGETEPYPSIARNEWIAFSAGRLFYATPEKFSARGLRDAISENEFDVLYLNSFFSYRASISIYLDQRRCGGGNILIAPRGEFSPGALALKRLKKRVWLTVARLLGLYRDVHWHASSTVEAADILRQFPDADGRIHIAADPITMGEGAAARPSFPVKAPGSLKIAFISRISPKKNLDGLIRILQGVERTVDLSIFGPAEDAAYWQKCRALIGALPHNVRVAHHGALDPEDVVPTFAAHDIFVFPTHGENFGHVIFESLRAGTPVLLSDQTPWQSSPCGALTVLPLDAVGEWRRKIEEAADRGAQEQAALRMATLDYAGRYLVDDRTRLDNLAMFRAVASLEGAP